MLSKFDTVDDKVGTALSLVYSTGKPIIYVGVGQKYQNLKELNVKTVVHSLLSWLKTPNKQIMLKILNIDIDIDKIKHLII